MADVRTLGNMIDRIADELKRDDLGSSASPGSVSAANIQNSIFDAIYEYQREHFFQNETVTSVATTQGVSTYDVPADFISMTQLDIIVNGTVYTLMIKSYEYIDTMDAISSSPTQGVPGWYAFYANQVRLYPTPNASTYSLRFIYQNKIPEPSGVTDTNWWTTTAESLIRNRAKWALNLEVIRDSNMAQLDKARENDALRKLMQETAMKLFTGGVTPSRF